MRAVPLKSAVRLNARLHHFAFEWRNTLLSLDARHRDLRVPVLLFASIATLVGTLPTGLTASGKAVVIALTAAILGWTMTKINDTVVAIAAVMALVTSGTIDRHQFYSALGHEIVWVLIAAFAIAMILRSSGLLECLLTLIASRVATFQSLYYSLCLGIAATAFVIPSTSARAAIVVPVFLAVTTALQDAGQRRALALMFPTAILLSAGASLIGAGAHAIAADAIQRATGQHIDFLRWLLIAGPFAGASTIAAAWLILRLHVSKSMCVAPLERLPVPPVTFTREQRMILAVLAVMIVLWMTAPVHGLGIGIVALAGLCFLLVTQVSTITSKDAFKAVDVELIIFLAMTFALANALSNTGADVWIASGLVHILPASFQNSQFALIVFLATVSLLAHIAIASRTARASILIPAVALPLAAMGHDPMILIMVTTLGSGFCQTMQASSKPVAIFAKLDVQTYEPRDLMRLASLLFPMMAISLIAYGWLLSALRA